jgi:predicted amidohydrolase
MNQQKIKVAVAQFPVSGDISKNLHFYLKFIREAKNSSVLLIVFSELSLCGFGPVDWQDLKKVDYQALAIAKETICKELKKFKLWGVIGTAIYSGKNKKPFNSAIIVDSKGNIRSNYAKIFGTDSELEFYSAGIKFPIVNKFPTVNLNGIKFGSLICYDFRFPELYRQYLRKDVRVMVHPFYQEGKPPYKSCLSHIAPIHIQSRAAENCMFIIAPNYGGKNSAWGSMIVNPNGEIVVQLPFISIRVD